MFVFSDLQLKHWHADSVNHQLKIRAVSPLPMLTARSIMIAVMNAMFMIMTTLLGLALVVVLVVVLLLLLAVVVVVVVLAGLTVAAVVPVPTKQARHLKHARLASSGDGLQGRTEVPDDRPWHRVRGALTGAWVLGLCIGCVRHAL